MIKKYFDIKLLLCAVVSAVVYSIAITSFSIPAGISRLLSDVFPKYFNINLSYSVIYFPINILLAILVYKNIGKKFTIYSIIQFSLVSLFTSLLNH